MGTTNEREEATRILQQLPKLLKKDPSLTRELYQLLEGTFATNRVVLEAIQEFRTHFKAVDKRFEELIASMNKRFEAMDKRFEAMDKRFEELIASMNQRFEAVDKRFEAMDKRFETMQSTLTAMVEQLNQSFQAVRRDVATISTAYGLRLEDIFREIFREALLTEDVDPKKLRRLDVLDDEGKVVPAGETTDIDLFVQDGNAVFVEVKSAMDLHDIHRFQQVVRMAEEQENVTATKLIAVTLRISPRNRIKAEHLGIRVITSEAFSVLDT